MLTGKILEFCFRKPGPQAAFGHLLVTWVNQPVWEVSVEKLENKSQVCLGWVLALRMSCCSFFFFISVTVFIYVFKIPYMDTKKYDHMYPQLPPPSLFWIFPHLPITQVLNSLIFLLLLFFSITLGAAHMWMSVEPSIGVWAIHQRTHPQRMILPPQQLSAVNRSWVRAGISYIHISSMLKFWLLEVVPVLCW